MWCVFCDCFCARSQASCSSFGTVPPSIAARPSKISWRKQGAAARIHLERLPAYAPEFNPQEGVWNLLKRRELKNRCCKDLAELEQELLLA
ncbi:transposase [Ktedonobacter robiniae]|uniref:transposase n=1 Tax=Ktedonobacter robiniae TaxID=2778365 RepID=UPI001F2E32CC|nr:transposase [Ktedonobacter robiniae]